MCVLFIHAYYNIGVIKIQRGKTKATYLVLTFQLELLKKGCFWDSGSTRINVGFG
jgi:hypothetical protein